MRERAGPTWCTWLASCGTSPAACAIWIGRAGGSARGGERVQRERHVLPLRLAERGRAEARALVVAREAREGLRTLRGGDADPRRELPSRPGRARREPAPGEQPHRALGEP